MDRSQVIRRIVLFLGVGLWFFLLLSIGSFHPADYPSHRVYPYPPTHNLCGVVGAFIAYYLFAFIGQGIFPILFFAGVILALVVFRNPVSDLWMRVAGIALITIAFTATV